jgi:hypothetical protein
MYVGALEDRIVPQPHILLTAGAVPKKIMERLGISSRLKVESSCGLRFEYLSGKTLQTGRRSMRNILIAMEGQLEAFGMVRYAMNQSRGEQGSYIFRIRTHPFLPWKAYERRFRVDLSDVPGFELSPGTSLEEDLRWADIVMYWSSTVALETLMMGKPVLHFDQRTILRYDPLFECPYFRSVVREDTPLREIIQGFEKMSLPEWVHHQEEARRYIQNYFHPVDVQNLEKFFAV